jgi:gluconolactonase
MRVVAKGLEFPEGPIALDDGSVLVVEIKRGTVARVDPDSGSVERIAETGGGPNGAALGPDGKLYVCNNGGFEWAEHNGITVPARLMTEDYTTGAIQVVDLGTGEVSDLYTEGPNHRINGPNDIVIDRQGGFYFTDYGKNRGRDMDVGAVYYAKLDGSEIVEVVFPMNTPNGVALSPAEDVLYVSETITGRIWGFELASPGVLKDPADVFGGGALMQTLPGMSLLDSMAVEESGNVCVATLPAGAITVFSPEGATVEVVDVPSDDPIVSNIAFGGPDLKTAYITSSGQGLLYEAEWPRAGLRLNQAATTTTAS